MGVRMCWIQVKMGLHSPHFVLTEHTLSFGLEESYPITEEDLQ